MAKQEETQTMEEYLLSQLDTPVILKDGTMMKKKEYQKRKDENLARWCERIAAMCCGRSLNDVLEMVSEVSKTSYIEGVHTEREVNKKFGRAEITRIKRI